MTKKVLYESCRRFTQDSSAANENWIEFSFDFGMSESEKKGVENGVDAHTQNRKNKENRKEPLKFSECEILPFKGFAQDNIQPEFGCKDSEHYRKYEEN